MLKEILSISSTATIDDLKKIVDKLTLHPHFFEAFIDVLFKNVNTDIICELYRKSYTPYIHKGIESYALRNNVVDNDILSLFVDSLVDLSSLSIEQLQILTPSMSVIHTLLQRDYLHAYDYFLKNVEELLIYDINLLSMIDDDFLVENADIFDRLYTHQQKNPNAWADCNIKNDVLKNFMNLLSHYSHEKGYGFLLNINDKLLLKKSFWKTLNPDIRYQLFTKHYRKNPTILDVVYDYPDVRYPIFFMLNDDMSVQFELSRLNEKWGHHAKEFYKLTPQLFSSPRSVLAFPKEEALRLKAMLDWGLESSSSMSRLNTAYLYLWTHATDIINNIKNDKVHMKEAVSAVAKYFDTQFSDLSIYKDDIRNYLTNIYRPENFFKDVGFDNVLYIEEHQKAIKAMETMSEYVMDYDHDYDGLCDDRYELISFIQKMSDFISDNDSVVKPQKRARRGTNLVDVETRFSDLEKEHYEKICQSSYADYAIAYLLSKLADISSDKVPGMISAISSRDERNYDIHQGFNVSDNELMLLQ